MDASTIIVFIDEYKVIINNINTILEKIIESSKVDHLQKISFPKHGDFNYVDPYGIRFDHFLNHARKNGFTITTQEYQGENALLFSTSYLSIIEQNRITINYVMLNDMWDSIKNKVLEKDNS